MTYCLIHISNLTKQNGEPMLIIFNCGLNNFEKLKQCCKINAKINVARTEIQPASKLQRFELQVFTVEEKVHNEIIPKF